jgi:NitT/TauT family transport system substrate-binding protein
METLFGSTRSFGGKAKHIPEENHQMSIAYRMRMPALAATFAVATLAGLATSSSAEMIKFDGVTAQGGPTAQVFPIFVAQEKGFYADEGLDVTLNYSKGSSDAARQLVAGNVDWGIFSSAATMQATQRGFPLKAIMQVYYPDTFDIVVPEDSDVMSMKDMAGKTIGLSDLAGGEVPMTRASIITSGLKEGSDVKLVVAGEGDPTTVRSFNEDRIQAYAGAKRDILLIPAQGIAGRSAETTVRLRCWRDSHRRPARRARLRRDQRGPSSACAERNVEPTPPRHGAASFSTRGSGR